MVARCYGEDVAARDATGEHYRERRASPLTQKYHNKKRGTLLQEFLFLKKTAMTYSPTKPVPARAEGKHACIMPSAAGVRNNTKQKKDLRYYLKSFIKTAMTYSPTNLCSTIGAVGLNFSVRNGKRWNPNAINRLNIGVRL